MIKQKSSVAFESAESYDEALVDAVIEQIRQDLDNCDATAIYDLLQNHVPKKSLEDFLPEWDLKEIQKSWGKPVTK